MSLPWELLRDRQGSLVLRDLVLRRQLPSPRWPGSTAALNMPLSILLVVARPTDVAFIDPRSSAVPMLDALDTLGGLVRVDFCDPPRR